MDGATAMRRLQEEVAHYDVSGHKVQLVARGTEKVEALNFYLIEGVGCITITHDAKGFIIHRSDDLNGSQKRRVDFHENFVSVKLHCLAIVSELAEIMWEKHQASTYEKSRV